jgi:hypothetical protein
MRLLAVFIGTLALAACQEKAAAPVGPPSDPPSGPIRPGEVIAYDVLAEHLSFNTKSRFLLLQLQGKVIQVRGPVWRIERDDSGAVLRFGTEKSSVVRAKFADANDLKDVQPGQVVEVIGTFEFRGQDVILAHPRLQNAQLEAQPAIR